MMKSASPTDPTPRQIACLKVRENDNHFELRVVLLDVKEDGTPVAGVETSRERDMMDEPVWTRYGVSPWLAGAIARLALEVERGHDDSRGLRHELADLLGLDDTAPMSIVQEVGRLVSATQTTLRARGNQLIQLLGLGYESPEQRDTGAELDWVLETIATEASRQRQRADEAYRAASAEERRCNAFYKALGWPEDKDAPSDEEFAGLLSATRGEYLGKLLDCPPNRAAIEEQVKLLVSDFRRVAERLGVTAAHGRLLREVRQLALQRATERTGRLLRLLTVLTGRTDGGTMNDEAFSKMLEALALSSAELGRPLGLRGATYVDERSPIDGPNLGWRRWADVASRSLVMVGGHFPALVLDDGSKRIGEWLPGERTCPSDALFKTAMEAASRAAGVDDRDARPVTIEWTEQLAARRWPWVREPDRSSGDAAGDWDPRTVEVLAVNLSDEEIAELRVCRHAYYSTGYRRWALRRRVSETRITTAQTPEPPVELTVGLFFKPPGGSPTDAARAGEAATPTPPGAPAPSATDQALRERLLNVLSESEGLTSVLDGLSLEQLVKIAAAGFAALPAAARVGVARAVLGG